MTTDIELLEYTLKRIFNNGEILFWIRDAGKSTEHVVCRIENAGFYLDIGLPTEYVLEQLGQGSSDILSTVEQIRKRRLGDPEKRP